MIEDLAFEFPQPPPKPSTGCEYCAWLTSQMEAALDCTADQYSPSLATDMAVLLRRHHPETAR